MSWRIVACDAGARSRGVSPSNPSSTCSSPNAGRMLSTVWSRSSAPSCTSCSAATVPIAFVIDAKRNIVFGAADAAPS